MIKKLLFLLVLLMTATTGAWADGIVCTASDLGKVLCTDGSIYENVSAATTAGKTAAAVIVYVDETNKNGLAIALTDESSTMNWSTAKSTCESKTPTVTGAKWCLPSQDQWINMFQANGGNSTSYTGLNTTITNAGGSNLQQDNTYWSSSEKVYLVSGGGAYWGNMTEDAYRVRACLAFAPPSYAVTLAEGTEDADKWTISPAEATKGTTVTATYSGTKRVKSVKAVVKGPVDLSKLDAPYEAQDGEVLTGTLDVANHPVKISIAEGATVTLAGVTINGVNNNSYSWAGITCEGDATIILKDGTTNTVKGFRASYPGIFVPTNKTLIIKGGAQGTGKLIASSNSSGDDGAAGIGGGYEHPCGNIEIQGGDITATGSNCSAGIGGCAEGTCGNITISGGKITAQGAYGAAGIGSGEYQGCGNITITGGTIEATGGGQGAGIGSGQDHAYCGTITITDGVTKVTATKGSGAPYSIGAGYGSSCGTVTIGGVVGAISESPYTYPASN